MEEQGTDAGIEFRAQRRHVTNQEKCMSIFDQLVATGEGMASQVRLMKDELIEVVKARDQIAIEVDDQLAELKEKFDYCIDIARGFLRACVELANYALDKELVKAIDDEIQKGMVTNLCTFVDIFLADIKDCRQCLEDFTDKCRHAKDAANERKNEYEDGTSSSEADLQKISHQVAQLALSERELREAGSEGDLPLPTADLIKELRAFTIENLENKTKEYIKLSKIFREATKSVEDLQKSLRELRKVVKEASRQTEDATSKVEGQNGLGKYSNFQKLNPAKVAAIKTKLNSLRHSMQTIHDQLGTNGELIDQKTSFTSSQSVQTTSESSQSSTLYIPEFRPTSKSTTNTARAHDQAVPKTIGATNEGTTDIDGLDTSKSKPQPSSADFQQEQHTAARGGSAMVSGITIPHNPQVSTGSRNKSKERESKSILLDGILYGNDS